jgi:hypothetical protein
MDQELKIKISAEGENGATLLKQAKQKQNHDYADCGSDYVVSER